MSKHIYIFLHVAKCGGYTLRYHIEKNIKKDKRLILSYNNLALNPFDPPYEFEIYKKAAKKFI